MPYITLFVLASGVLGLLIGLLRGGRRKIAGISAIIVSVIISMIVSPLIVKAFFTEKDVLTIMELIGFAEKYNELVAAGPSVSELVSGIPVAIVSPILFLIVYLLTRFIFRIIAGIVTKILFKEKNWLKSRVWGLSLGFVQGVLSAMIFVAIIAGFICTVNNVTDTVLSQDSEQFAEIQSDIKEVDSYINIIADDPIVKILDKTNFIFDSLNSFKFNGEKVVLKDELTTIVDAGVYLLPISENTNVSTWTEAEYEMLDVFVDKFGSSEILPVVSSELLSCACEKWADGETFMGIEPPKADETIDPLLIALYASLKNSNSETIVVDLNTLVDILRIAGKHELLSGNTDDILSKLSGTLVSELLNTISTNERFSVLVPEITNLSMRMLASAINLPANAGEVYSNITSSISSDLNNYLAGEMNAESTEQLKNSITLSLKKNGVNVSDDVASLVSDTITTAFEGKENVTQADIESYFADFAIFYEAYEKSETNTASNGDSVKLTNTSGVAKAPVSFDYKSMSYEEKISALAAIGVLDQYQTAFDLTAPDNMLQNGMTADQFVNYLLSIFNSVVEGYEKVSSLGASETNPLVSLKSSETIITSKATAEDLLIDSSEYVLNQSDVENISQGFENIATFISSYTQLSGDVSLENISQLDLEAIGKALDLLQNTDLLGDKVGTVADVLIVEMTGADISLSETMKNNNTTFESLMTTVKSTSNVIGNLSNNDMSEEEIAEAYLDLLLNITPETSGVISEIVTVDFMIQWGIPNDFAKVSANALKIALVEMANLPESEHDVEAKKLQQLFELAASAGTSNQPLIGINGIFKTENDIIDMIVQSNVAYKTIVAISVAENGVSKADALGLGATMNTQEKASLAEVIINYYNDNKDSTSILDLADRLNSIAILFDLGVTVK